MPDRRIRMAVNAADGAIESIAAGFSGQLSQIVMQAQTRTVSVLQGALSIDGRGRIARTRENRRALGTMAKLFRNEMRGAGYDTLLASFTASWPGLMPLFQDTLNAIFETWKEPPPVIGFTATDLGLVAKQSARTEAELLQLVASLGRQAQAKAMMSYGALSMPQLTGVIARYTGQTLPAARSIAATATSTYYRTIADAGYREIEEDRGPLEYTYEGPADLLTRPFCNRVLAAKGPFTRAEIMETIEAWKGHSLPNVMRTGGGYACRHQWIIYTGGKRRKRKAAAE